jgi:hypothetical protein
MGIRIVIDYTGGLTALEQDRVAAIRHVIHEYANFVSSAEMVLSGLDIDGIPFKPPINTHVSHAFYLNCRKLADFFQNRRGGNDDIVAEHYAPGFSALLPVCDDWRGPMNKQLTHVTYAREKGGREIDGTASRALYAELKRTWREFRAKLVGGIYEAPFNEQLAIRKEPYPDGHPSEFRTYDLE